METFDLLVIGSGPGGQRAAIQAAKLGRRAAVIERPHITVRHEIEMIQHQLSRNGVQVISGMAKLPDPHTVQVTSATGHTARRTSPSTTGRSSTATGSCRSRRCRGPWS